MKDLGVYYMISSIIVITGFFVIIWIFEKKEYDKKRKEDLEEEQIRKTNKRIAIERKKDILKNAKKVLKVIFKCVDCSEKWFYLYPKNISVGYSGFGPPGNENGWVIDNYSYDVSLYKYECKNCGNNDITILSREKYIK